MNEHQHEPVTSDVHAQSADVDPDVVVKQPVVEQPVVEQASSDAGAMTVEPEASPAADRAPIGANVEQPIETEPASTQPSGGTNQPVSPQTSEPAPRPTVAAEPPPAAEIDEDAQRNAEHALRPGSHGLAVRELAQLLEACGVETYITRGENPDNVFEDELGRQVIELVGDTLWDDRSQWPRPEQVIVDAPVWLALREKAGQTA